jgi:hypothetical protein
MPPKEMQQTKNKGGRPKAAWTPRRDQKVVHLYTLTKLTMLEISVEMKEEGFAPRCVKLSNCIRSVKTDMSLTQRKCNSKAIEGIVAQESSPRHQCFQAAR